MSQKSFHAMLGQIRTGDHWSQGNVAWQRKTINDFAENAILQAYFMQERGKTAIRSQLVTNTTHMLHFVKAMVSEMGRLEQSGKEMLDDGKFNLGLKCSNGSNFEYCSPVLSLNDRARMQVFERPDGLLVAYGVKPLETTFTKCLRAGGYVPLASPKYLPPGDVLKGIAKLRQHLEGRMDLGQGERTRRLADLDAISDVLETTKTMRSDEYAEGNDHGRADKETRKIAQLVSKIKTAIQDDAEQTGRDFAKIFDASLPYSSNTAWSLTTGEADLIARALDTHGTKDTRNDFASFIKAYSDELGKTMQAAPLQPQMSDFLKLSKIAILYSVSKATGENAPESKLSSMNAQLIELNRCITRIVAISNELEALHFSFNTGKISAKHDKAGAFKAICEICEKRRSLCDELDKMKNGLGRLSYMPYDKSLPDEENRVNEYIRKLSAVIPMTAVHNFVRTSKEEARLWKGFLAANDSLLRKWASMTYPTASSKIRKFVGAVEKEPPICAAGKARSVKTTVREYQKEILERIKNMEKYAPNRAGAIRSMFDDTASHLLYKQGGVQVLCDSLEFHITAERLLMEKKDASGKLEELVGKNRLLFSLLDKYGMAGKVLEHIDRFNHFEPNALDSNPDFEKLVESGSRGHNMDIAYSYYADFSSGPNGSGQVFTSDKTPEAFLSMLQKHKITPELSEAELEKIANLHYGDKYYLDYGGKRYCVEPKPDGLKLYPEKLKITTASQKFALNVELPLSAPEYSDSEFDDHSIDEIMFGAKEPLDIYLSKLGGAYGPGGKTLECAYDAISGVYLRHGKDFDHLKDMMADPSSNEFLASFALKQRKLNGAVFVPNKGEISYNDPSRLGGTNNLLEGAGFSAEQIEYYTGRVNWYLQLSPARIMMQAMHSRKWEWALECAERIAKH